MRMISLNVSAHKTWFYNGMLHHSFVGELIFLSLKHFIAPSLDLIPCLPSQPRREAIRAFNSTKGATQNAAIKENFLLQTLVCCITCVDLMSNLSDCVNPHLLLLLSQPLHWKLNLGQLRDQIGNKLYMSGLSASKAYLNHGYKLGLLAIKTKLIKLCSISGLSHDIHR